MIYNYNNFFQASTVKALEKMQKFTYKIDKNVLCKYQQKNVKLSNELFLKILFKD